MSDYRSTLQSVQEIWQNEEKALNTAVKDALKRKQPPEHDFICALFQHARGNSTYLISYLRSSRGLTSRDREYFAQVLEGDIQRKTVLGRPVQRDERDLAGEARQFYRLWRAENKRVGVRDHGFSNQMKDATVAFLVASSGLPLNCEKIRLLMDRPRSRRG